MKKFWIIRHGETSENIGESSRSNTEIFLTKNGEQQVHWLQKHFPHQPSQIFASELPRSQQSAKPMAEKYDLPVQIRSYLNEFTPLGLSSIAGLGGMERKQAYNDYWENTAPEQVVGKDGESFSTLVQRIEHFFADIENIPDKSVLFGHSVWIKTLAWRLLGYPTKTHDDMLMLRRFQHAFPTPNASTYQIEVFNKKLMLTALPELTPPCTNMAGHRLYF